MKKRGMSGVVAVVLIILMAVAGVGIIWGVILPFLDADVRLSESAVSIDTSGGFTSYDEAQGIACVQVVRNDEEIDGLKIIFIIRGGSHTVSILKDDLVDANSKKRYCVNLSSYGVPSSVTVVPIREGEDGVGTTYDIPHSPFSPGAYATIVGGGLKYVDDDPENPLNQIFLTYYYDGDGDGYGDDLIFQDFEEGKNDSGYILVGEDCDDGDGDISPDEDEILNNNVDEDCDGWMGLNDCMILDLEGGKYELENDLLGDVSANFIDSNCFIIKGDNIFLDLKGHVVDGFFNEGIGVQVLNGGATINNGTFQNFSNGLTLESNNNILTNLVSTSNVEGVRISRGLNNRLTDIIANSNTQCGIFDYLGDGNVFDNITVFDSPTGIHFYAGSDYKIENSILCSESAVYFMDSPSSCSGLGNIFSFVDGDCDGWPIEGTHYEKTCP